MFIKILFIVKKTIEPLFSKAGLCIFLVMGSCSSDDDPVNPIPPADQTCLVTNVDHPTLSYVITRNDEGLPTRLTYTKTNGTTIEFSCSFEYDELNRLIKLGHETIFFTYKYDNLNRVISEKFETQPNSPVPYLYDTERIFTYNDEGYLDSAIYSPEVYERYVYDNNGNMIQRFVKYSGDEEYLSNEYLAFDDKKNPFYEFSFYHNLLLNQSGVFATVTTFNPVRHKTNILESKVYDQDGTSTAYSASYNYNDSGYPISGKNNITFGYQCE